MNRRDGRHGETYDAVRHGNAEEPGQVHGVKCSLGLELGEVDGAVDGDQLGYGLLDTRSRSSSIPRPGDISAATHECQSGSKFARLGLQDAGKSAHVRKPGRFTKKGGGEISLPPKSPI